MIDFLPTGTGVGTFGVDPFTQSGSFTTVAGTAGTIKDLNLAVQPVGVPFTLTDWMVFAANPNITFTLQLIPAGVFTSAGCSGPAMAGQNCTPVVPGGSPFNLTNTSATSSVVSFKTDGTVTNRATSEVSNFDGTFSTQFTNQNLQQLLATVGGGGSVQATYSANFILTSGTTGVPEPATITLSIAGVIFILAGTLRKRRRLES